LSRTFPVTTSAAAFVRDGPGRIVMP